MSHSLTDLDLHLADSDDLSSALFRFCLSDKVSQSLTQVLSETTPVQYAIEICSSHGDALLKLIEEKEPGNYDGFDQTFKQTMLFEHILYIGVFFRASYLRPLSLQVAEELADMTYFDFLRVYADEADLDFVNYAGLVDFESLADRVLYVNPPDCYAPLFTSVQLMITRLNWAHNPHSVLRNPVWTKILNEDVNYPRHLRHFIYIALASVIVPVGPILAHVDSLKDAIQKDLDRFLSLMEEDEVDPFDVRTFLDGLDDYPNCPASTTSCLILSGHMTAIRAIHYELFQDRFEPVSQRLNPEWTMLRTIDDIADPERVIYDNVSLGEYAQDILALDDARLDFVLESIAPLHFVRARTMSVKAYRQAALDYLVQSAMQRRVTHHFNGDCEMAHRYVTDKRHILLSMYDDNNDHYGLTLLDSILETMGFHRMDIENTRFHSSLFELRASMKGLSFSDPVNMPDHWRAIFNKPLNKVYLRTCLFLLIDSIPRLDEEMVSVFCDQVDHLMDYLNGTPSEEEFIDALKGFSPIHDEAYITKDDIELWTHSYPNLVHMGRLAMTVPNAPFTTTKQ